MNKQESECQDTTTNMAMKLENETSPDTSKIKEKMKQIYLMIKTHNITGKKYLCKREADSDDKAIKYTGSGLLWKQHIKEFGKDISTEIIYKCPISAKEEFRNVAIEYSIKFNIVESDGWLNVITEEGQGGSRSETNGTKGKKWMHKGEKHTLVPEDQINMYLSNGWIVGHSDIQKHKNSLAQKGKKSWNKGKKMPDGFGKKVSEARIKKYGNPHPQIKKPNLSKEDLGRIRKEISMRPNVMAILKEPRKPLVTCQHIITGEIKTLGRKQWWDFDKVDYRKLLIGKKSKGWKSVGPWGIEPQPRIYEIPARP